MQEDSDTPQEPAGERLDVDGRERPRFLLAFPKDAELQQLSSAFERGDFAFVRANAERVAKASSDPQVAAAARELRRRIDPDPLVVQLLLMALALLGFLVAWTYFTR